MRYRYSFLLILLTVCTAAARAQKPFTEGTISYKVKLESTDHKIFNGTYTFTFKGGQIRKDLKLDNGYTNTELLNIPANEVYSLQSMNGKNYAIQLNISDIVKAQQRYTGYNLTNEQGNEHIAGCAAYKASLSYKGEAPSDVYYTKEWRPSQSLTFERFPDAGFLPLNYAYKEDNGMVMRFEAEKISAGPVESSVFRIPADHKLISNEEYKKMSR